MEALSSKLDWLDAATIYRELRWRGVVVRSQIDTLISAAAIRLDVPVLHHDRDFGHIARYTPLGIGGGPEPPARPLVLVARNVSETEREDRDENGITTAGDGYGMRRAGSARPSPGDCLTRDARSSP